MSSTRLWAFRIRHILGAIARIQDYTRGLDQDSFAGNSMAVDAVIRNLQVSGEATRHVPEDIQTMNAQIPWSSMQKMRHVLVHDYDEVDVEIVWTTVQNDLPPLIEPLARLLEQATEFE